ncbi:MAG TPA: hypothetical protein VLY20_02205 [Nitrospiria bacterium]|nr:hypothetical protein [Nitrospiria bacterium]
MPIRTTGFFLILLLGAALAGCGAKYIQSLLPAELEKHSIQEVGLIPFIVEPQSTGEIRSGRVEDDGAQMITDQFYQKLIERHVTVIRWGNQAPLPSDGGAAPLSDLERAEQIGKILKTSTVLFGSVTTFTEREGDAYGIRKPASVGFTVQLIHPEDGHLLWKASYNETQKSLMEDISAFHLFFRRGGRWLTAAELSDDGVEQLMAASPWAQAKTR